MDPNPPNRPNHMFDYEQPNSSQPKKQDHTKLLAQGCGLLFLAALLFVVAAVGIFVALFLFGSGS